VPCGGTCYDESVVFSFGHSNDFYDLLSGRKLVQLMPEMDLAYQLVVLLLNQVISLYGVSILAVVIALSLIRTVGYLGRKS